MIYLTISLLVFWAYFYYSTKTVGVKSSISATFFHIKHPVLFRLFIIGISVPLMIYAFNKTTGIMVSASLILWIAFAAGSKDYENDEIENRNHVIGATGGILAAYVSFSIEYVTWSIFYKELFFWSIIAFLISALIILPVKRIKIIREGVKNHTTWIEVFAYNIIILTLLAYETISI